MSTNITEGRDPLRHEYCFNDDDLYVFDLSTLKIIRTIGSSSCEAIGGRTHGYKLHPGQGIAKGMTAKYMGVHA